MDVKKEIKHYHRFEDYDYSRGAALFITLTTSPQRQVFGVVKSAMMELSDFGRDVKGSILFTFSKAKGITLFGYCVMPDHVHFRVYLAPGLTAKDAIFHLNHVVGRFKSYTTHLYQVKYGGFGVLWQEGYHDWLCVSREMIDAVERYISYNALKWELRNNRGLLRLREPLLSPRLAGEYWRGVGAVELVERLGTAAQAGQDGGAAQQAVGGAAQSAAQACQVGGERARNEGLTRAVAGRPDGVAPPWAARPLIALRVSRRCSPRDIQSLVSRITAKAASYTIISGFISPGERAVLDALANEPTATAIKVLPYAMAHDYQPSVALMPAIADNRLAVIARGNSPEEISRSACLDLNSRLIDLADRAIYVLPGEMRRLK